MPRMCAVCHRPPREGERMFPIRLREQEDLEAENCKVDELALYSACVECAEAHRARVARRTGRELNQVTNNDMC